MPSGLGCDAAELGFLGSSFASGQEFSESEVLLTHMPPFGTGDRRLANRTGLGRVTCLEVL